MNDGQTQIYEATTTPWDTSHSYLMTDKNASVAEGKVVES